MTFLKNLYIITCLLIFNNLFAQTKIDSIPVTQIKIFNTNYKEFEIVENYIYAITNGDSLIRINIKTNKFSFLKKGIKSIAKTNKNKIIAVTETGNVILQTTDTKFFIVDKFEGEPYKILMDKFSDFVIVTTKYVRYKKENFTPHKDSPMFRKAGSRYKGGTSLIPIDFLYVDNDNRIWFGYDAGEWGGDVCFFELSSKKFYKGESLRFLYDDKYNVWPKNKNDLLNEFPDKIKIFDRDTLSVFPHEFTLSNIKGITEDERGNIYTSESLMHFMVRGSITKFRKINKENFYKSIDISEVLEHKVYEKSTEEYIDSDGVTKTMELAEWKEVLEYLGAITHNYFDKHIYYYTNKGFFKIIEKENYYSKEFIFRPWITWTYGMSHSVGYQMNVIKMEFISKQELVFLTSNNGIGYFDGVKVKYFM